MKKLQSNFTTPEQSKRLLEIGVPAWTADCHYTQFQTMIWVNRNCIINYENGSIPCWSVGWLMEIYDTCFISPKSRSYWCAHTRLIGVQYVDYILDCYKNALADNLLDFSKLDE